MSMLVVLRRLAVSNARKSVAVSTQKQLQQSSVCVVALNRCYSRPVTHEDVRNLTKVEWEERLTPEQFSVCREQCTEPPFSGIYTSHYEPGTYTCVCCGEALFSSETKFESGTGWPSFSSVYKKESGLTNVIERPENSLDRSTFRTEVICRTCDSHLGHVFEDGPPPTGKHYCINSLALGFKTEQKK